MKIPKINPQKNKHNSDTINVYVVLEEDTFGLSDGSPTTLLTRKAAGNSGDSLFCPSDGSPTTLLTRKATGIILKAFALVSKLLGMSPLI